MPDADDFDVEELRQLLRGGGGQQPAPPATGARAPARPKSPGKAGRPAASAKDKPAKAPKKR